MTYGKIVKLFTEPATIMGRAIINKPIRYFTIFTFVFGVIFLLLIPPFQIPDELTHFTRSYEVSELKSPQRHAIGKGNLDEKGSFLPASILATYKGTKLHLQAGSIDVPQAKKYHWRQTENAYHIPLNKGHVTFIDTSASPAYLPVLYFPQALTIKILQLFNAPIILMLYATRLTGLIIWITLAALSLRLLRQFKYVHALIGVLLLPMFIAQASASTDPLINGLALVCVAIVASLALRNKILSKKWALILITSLTIMTLSKPAYLAFGLLVFVIPMRKSIKRDIILKLSCLCAPFLIFVTWWLATADHGSRPIFIDSVSIAHAHPSAQVAYLVPDLYRFIEPFVNSLFLGWSDNIYTSLIGEFGKLDTPLPLLFVVLGYLVLFVAIFVRPDKNVNLQQTKDLPRTKINLPIQVLTGVSFIVGVYLAMYVYSTPPGEKIVTGVQGRYFLPLLPMFAVFIPKGLLMMKRRAYLVLQTALPLVLIVVSVVIVALRYYYQYP